MASEGDSPSADENATPSERVVRAPTRSERARTAASARRVLFSPSPRVSPVVAHSPVCAGLENAATTKWARRTGCLGRQDEKVPTDKNIPNWPRFFKKERAFRRLHQHYATTTSAKMHRVLAVGDGRVYF